MKQIMQIKIDGMEINLNLELYEALLKKFGIVERSSRVIEEASEFITAISHMIRNDKDEAYRNNFQEELGDIIMMLANSIVLMKYYNLDFHTIIENINKKENKLTNLLLEK